MPTLRPRPRNRSKSKPRSEEPPPSKNTRERCQSVGPMSPQGTGGGKLRGESAIETHSARGVGRPGSRSRHADDFVGAVVDTGHYAQAVIPVEQLTDCPCLRRMLRQSVDAGEPQNADHRRDDATRSRLGRETGNTDHGAEEIDLAGHEARAGLGSDGNVDRIS